MDFSALSEIKMQAGGPIDITDEQIQRIVRVGWWTGTSFNLQPWKCIILRERHAEFWKNYSRILGILHKSNPMIGTIGINLNEPKAFVEASSVTLVLCADESRIAPWFSGPAFVEDSVKMIFFKDVGAILQSMKLAILNEGFGYAQVNMDLSIKGLDDALQGYLELPKGFRVVGILTVGKPDVRDVVKEMPLSAFSYPERWKRKMHKECPKAESCGRFEFDAAICCSVCKNFLTDSYYFDSASHALLCEKHFREWQAGKTDGLYFQNLKNKTVAKLLCSYWTDCDDYALYRQLECARCHQPMESHFFNSETMEKLCLSCAQAAVQI